jgi:hypothetical protein
MLTILQKGVFQQNVAEHSIAATLNLDLLSLRQSRELRFGKR